MNSSMRILLADDSRFFRTIERKFLQKTPLEILEAENCAATLECARQMQPALIYMAFSLVPDGGAACCEALKRDPGLRNIPVVLICDRDEPGQLDQAKSSGADAWLCKPLDRHAFLQAGRKFLAVIREHRQPSFFPLSFSLNGESFAGRCLEISPGGIFIESQADLAAGSEITLSFKLPDSGVTGIECVARVSWLNRKPNPMKPHYPHGFGAQFLTMPEAVQRALMAYSARKSGS